MIITNAASEYILCKSSLGYSFSFLGAIRYVKTSKLDDPLTGALPEWDRAAPFPSFLHFLFPVLT
jgi:hypothetical protein